MIRPVIHCTLIILFVLLCASPIYAADYRILAIRVDFTTEEPDHDTTSGIGTFDLRDYATDPDLQEKYYHPWDVPPHDRQYFSNHLDALAHYWQTVSDGSVAISYDIWPRSSNDAYTMGNTFYKYGNGRSDDQTYTKLAGLVREALDAIKASEGEAIDVSQYDTIMIIHAGIGSETSGMLNDIPSAYLSTDDFIQYLGTQLTYDGSIVEHAIVLPEMTSGNGNAGLNGIMAQMFGFRLGLPSLSNNDMGTPGAGGWSLMDVGGMAWGYQTLGFIPTQPCIWAKAELGFVDPIVVTQDTTLDLAATHITGNNPRGIRIDITDDEYLLIENRFSATPHDSLPPGIVFSDGDSSGVWTSVSHYDAFIPGSGVLVWHIIESIIEEGRSSNSVNDDSFRRGVDLLEADGIQDIGALFAFGDNRSEYSIGHDDDTYKSNGTATISPSTTPHTGSIWGGSSGVTITVNSEPGEVANITISFAGRLAGFPVFLPGAQQITATDLNDDGVDELVISLPDSFLVVSNTGITSNYVRLDKHPPLASIPGGPDKGAKSLYLINTWLSAYYTYSNNVLTDSFAGTIDTFMDTVWYDGPLFSLNHEFVLRPVFNSRYIQDTHSFGNNYGELVDYYNGPGPFHLSIPDSAQIVSASGIPDRFAALNADHDVIIGQFALGGSSENSAMVYNINSESTTGPLIVDIDRDDDYETVITADRELRIYESDGTYASTRLYDEPVGDPVAADIDRDGYPEVIISVRSGIFAYRADGAIQTGFPYELPPGNDTEYITSQPVIGDLDNDGRFDIACATSARRMVSFDPDGLQTAGFPFALVGEVTASPCLFYHDSNDMVGIAYVTTDGIVCAHDLGVILESEAMPWPMLKGGPSLSGAFLNEKITSGLKTTAPFEVFCYPNPITDGTATFRVIPAVETDVTITLFTLDGQRILETQRSSNTILPGVPNDITFDSSNLASGLYVARIQTNHETVIYKVGVQK